MAPTPITARYVTRFRCIGPDCEDTCCQGWRVPVDEEHFVKLRSRMSQQRATRDEFKNGHERNREEGRSGWNHAWIRLGRDGACPYLTGTRMCSVQERFGAEYLGDTCAVYPRTMASAGARSEVWGSFSCPEMARLGLLADDAMEIVDADPAMFPRPRPRGALPGGAAEPYLAYFDDIRGAVLRLLVPRRFPLSTRLVLVSWLAREVHPFFRAGAEGFDERRLAAVMAMVDSPQAQEGWDHELQGYTSNGRFATTLVVELLRQRLADPAGGFGKLVSVALASYGEADGVRRGEGETVQVDPEALAQAYLARRDQRLREHGERFDLVFGNFSVNYWLKDWYVRSPDLQTHAMRLLVRLAVMRFLLVSAPELAGAALLAGEDERRAAFDRAAVKVAYAFCRAVEHNGRFLGEIEVALAKNGLAGFAHAAALALQ